MIKKLGYSIFILSCFCLSAQAQSDSLVIRFEMEFDKLPFELHKKYVSQTKDTLSVETFKCYISNIKIQYQDASSLAIKNRYYLLDLEHPETFKVPLTPKGNQHITTLTFDIGIDSLTASSGAMDGALDPIKGMYWAWQSGYINTKIEGKSSSCKTRNNEFKFHIGGYREPYYAKRTLSFDINRKSSKDIIIGIDFNRFFSSLKLQETNSVMIPGKQALQLADYCSKMFYIK